MRRTADRSWMVLVLLLAGCSDPYDRVGTWHPVGINRADLDNEAVNKADSIVGHGTPGSDAILDATAITRLYEDKSKPLKSEATTTGTGGGGGS